ncbi:hypothetical protein [Burkholderia territorii]|uniref:Uncharacterized protein n=1 Tax=Burkholderia territorii TaxID=1503055 RepID=A0A6L3NLR6_9BURK|nr:hypothetical protein [Burkholderia territorii]KAB0685363.1 hypothetical protein F7R13_04775 [Burkholderia territorii]MBM2771839.1 hypothetical protein [Burkholderia territorii]VWB65416.1 hypothetical protein BTE28158_03057 [Burkholderia territorii]
MLTDRRVARSITETSLSNRSDLDPARFKQEIQRLIEAVPPPPAGLERRALEHYAIDHVLLPLEAIGMTGYVAVQEGESTLIASIVAGNVEAGFHWLHLVMRLIEKRYMFYEPLRMSRHAIERCMQRTASRSFEDMHEHLSQAFGSAIPLMTVGVREQWQQCAVPVRDGLFVGSISDGGATWHMDTFISRKNYEPPSRWDNFKGIFPEFPDWSRDERRNINVVGEWMNAQLRKIIEHTTIVSRVPFLKHPYVPGVDRDSGAWAGAPSAVRRK